MGKTPVTRDKRSFTGRHTSSRVTPSFAKEGKTGVTTGGFFIFNNNKVKEVEINVCDI